MGAYTEKVCGAIAGLGGDAWQRRHHPERCERSAAAGGSPARGPAIDPCARLPAELGFHTLILGVRARSLATGFAFGDGLVSKAAF